jgi:hypothetical protein
MRRAQLRARGPSTCTCARVAPAGSSRAARPNAARTAFSRSNSAPHASPSGGTRSASKSTARYSASSLVHQALSASSTVTRNDFATEGSDPRSSGSGSEKSLIFA